VADGVDERRRARAHPRAPRRNVVLVLIRNLQPDGGDRPPVRAHDCGEHASDEISLESCSAKRRATSASRGRTAGAPSAPKRWRGKHHQRYALGLPEFQMNSTTALCPGASTAPSKLLSAFRGAHICGGPQRHT
ncbi:unnamed protein product, partial [Ectocarpus sp. 4 AP-2014]